MGRKGHNEFLWSGHGMAWLDRVQAATGFMAALPAIFFFREPLQPSGQMRLATTRVGLWPPAR